MTLKTKSHRVLVVQARLNSEIITAEQENLKKNIEITGCALTFINPLQDEHILWEDPDAFLHQFDSSIWLGSAEVDLSIITEEQKQYIKRTLPLAKNILENNRPALGICLGHQTFAFAAGATINRDATEREFGTTPVRLTTLGKNDPTFTSFPNMIPMVFAHNDSVVTLPDEFQILGSTVRNQFSALRRGNIVTLQGHPEITDTTKLKKRILSAQQRTHLPAYAFTSPLIDPGPTDTIIRNFLLAL